MSYNKNYYRKHKNRLLVRQKKRNVRRKTVIKNYMEQYYKENRSDLLKRQKSYYEKNVGYYRDYMKSYHKKRGKFGSFNPLG